MPSLDLTTKGYLKKFNELSEDGKIEVVRRLMYAITELNPFVLHAEVKMFLSDEYKIN